MMLIRRRREVEKAGTYEGGPSPPAPLTRASLKGGVLLILHLPQAIYSALHCTHLN